MNQEDLAALGKGMREGQRARVSHACGNGRTLLVTREGARVRGWCFRCQEPVFAELALSLKDNLYRASRATSNLCGMIYEGSEAFPEPLRPFAEWPQSARLWFLQAGLGVQQSRDMRAGWHEGMERIVMPLVNHWGGHRSWTARAVDGRLPKYLTGYLPEGFVAELGLGTSNGPPVVVEDWLSANKVAMAGQHVICMLGTTPKPATLARLLEFPEVAVWLDNDLPPKHPVNYGQIMARRLRKLLKGFGVRVNNIASGRDPKLLNQAEIRALIAAARTH